MSSVRAFHSLAACALLAVAGPACSPEGGPGGRGGGGGGGGTDGGGGGGGERSQPECTDGIDNDMDGLGDCTDPDCAVWAECGGTVADGGTGGGSDAGLEECASVVSEAESTFAPVDIIWVVDSSGSMSEEADLVQRNINSFATDISTSGVDYHVIMMTDPGFATVPPPLGTDPTRYLAIDQPVGSTNAFELLLSRYDDYSHFLRDGAVTHIVVVTDDESAMGETTFRTQMETKLGHSFRFHAVASEDTTHEMCAPFGGLCFTQDGCAGPHGEAADIGARYYSLAMMTGGTTFSICAEDWSPLFATLRESVVVSAMLPCYYELPEAPEGEMFDKERVNVVYTDPGGVETVLPRAIDESKCWDAAGTPVRAWHYDDNDAPTQIILCPAACDLVEAGGEGARVDIALGCETEMILI